MGCYVEDEDAVSTPSKLECHPYSRSRGLFAGVSLEGSTLRSDDGQRTPLRQEDGRGQHCPKECRACPGGRSELDWSTDKIFT